MTDDEKELRFTVLYRGKPLQLTTRASSTLGDLGREIVDLTGVAPHTLRLMIPKRPPLQPMSEQQSTGLLRDSGITEGLTVRMMGASPSDLAGVSQPPTRDRILGFADEEQRFRQRSGYTPSASVLPKGNYIFCDFRTLQLPGIELDPPPAMALKIMHKLASDRGVVAIMSKHRWRVGVMTEMAPVGYVGISPKCILGFNKNYGEEISLRLRTDDLKGFRKYESMKKTLLHELAHMVHSEHDEKFHALDKQLNEEAIALDWTRSHGHTLGGVRHEEEEQLVDAGGVQSRRGYRLGGNEEQARSMDARSAAAAAALRRLGDAMKRTPESGRGESMQTAIQSATHEETTPDPEGHGTESMVVVAEGLVAGNESNDHDSVNLVVDASLKTAKEVPDKASNGYSGREEPDPDDAVENVSEALVRSHEPDPDESSTGFAGKDEPDPDQAVDILVDAPAMSEEPDPDEALDMVKDPPARSDEPDPDEVSDHYAGKHEPDPDEAMDLMVDFPVRNQESDPDEASSDDTCKVEPGLDEPSSDYEGKGEPDPDEPLDSNLDTACSGQEPDPDDAVKPDALETLRGMDSGPDYMDVCRKENCPDQVVDTEMGLLELYPATLAGRSQSRTSEGEPDPDEAVVNSNEQLAYNGCSRMAGNMKSWTGRYGTRQLITPEKSR